MKVSEIFRSIEGEGIRTGLPSTFVRLYGCNLKCSYCDSRYSVDQGDYLEMSVEDIVYAVISRKCYNVTLTGGEPLIHPGIIDLMDALCNLGCWVNVETNGTCLLPYRSPKLFYTVDYKTGCSGENKKMNPDAFAHLQSTDVLKFVVGSMTDLDEALTFWNSIPIEKRVPQVFLSPVFGKIDPEHLVNFVLNNELWNWKVQVQLHKIIWDPDERGV